MKLKLFSLVVLFSIGSIAEAQSNPHYMSTDPAIREMMISLDMPRTTGGVFFTSMPSDPAIREMLISMDMPRYAESVPAKIMNGSWQLNLSDERSIKLTLQQSGSAVFGKGIIMNSTISQAAYASGSVSENSLNLEVVPESATELYVISINIRSMPYEGQYVEFQPNSILQTGTITMSTNDFAHQMVKYCLRMDAKLLAGLGNRGQLGNSYEFKITLHDTRDRSLISLEGFLSTNYISNIPEISYSVALPVSDLIGNPDDLALAAAKHLFERFNWIRFSGEGLRPFQKELRDKKW